MIWTFSPIVSVCIFVKLWNALFVAIEPNEVQACALKFNVLRIVHPENALSPIDVTEFPIVTEVNPEQYWNVPIPIEVTELGMVTEDNFEHLVNAQSPIEVTEFPIVTEINPWQLENAYDPIEVTEFGMVIEVNLEPLNAKPSIEMTVFGIVKLPFFEEEQQIKLLWFLL